MYSVTNDLGMFETRKINESKCTVKFTETDRKSACKKHSIVFRNFNKTNEKQLQLFFLFFLSRSFLSFFFFFFLFFFFFFDIIFNDNLPCICIPSNVWLFFNALDKDVCTLDVCKRQYDKSK